MLNKIILIGHLGDDPKITNTDKGQTIANFSLATSESYINKDSGEKITNTEWHRLVCYGKGATILEKYTKKGSKLYVEGSVHTRQWEDNEGVKRYNTEIKVKDFKFLGGNDNSNSTKTEQSGQPVGGYQDEDDDLPF